MLAMFQNWRKPSLAIAAIVAASFFAPMAGAQKILSNSDVAVSAFAQFTGDSTGDGITVHPLKSGGGQAAFRHVYHPWLGYEASYGYTRYTDRYTSSPFDVQHNVHEFSGSYLITTPRVLGIQPFGLAGVSALLFSPSLNGGQRTSAQARPGVNFGVGVNLPVLTSHLGVRIQYRGVMYKTPDYDDPLYKTGTWRLTNEPAVGAYLRF